MKKICVITVDIIKNILINLYIVDIVDIMENENILSDTEHSVEKEEELIEKPRKNKTKKQLKAMEKARQQHLQNAEIRRQKRAIEKEELKKRLEELEEEHIKQLEEKILKKALQIKKRTIIEDAYLEKVIGIDDIPLDKLNELVKKLKIKKEKDKPNTSTLFKFV